MGLFFVQGAFAQLSRAWLYHEHQIGLHRV